MSIGKEHKKIVTNNLVKKSQQLYLNTQSERILLKNKLKSKFFFLLGI